MFKVVLELEKELGANYTEFVSWIMFLKLEYLLNFIKN